MRAPKHRARGSRPLRILIWTVIIAVALAALFYVFEFVVPRLLPANF